MSIFSGLSNIFSTAATPNSTASAATTALNAAVAANPALAPYTALAAQILGNASNTNTSPIVAAPVAPSEAQLAAAMQAVVAAQNTYQQLLAQVKGVEAYNAAMQAAQAASEAQLINVIQPVSHPGV